MNFAPLAFDTAELHDYALLIGNDGPFARGTGVDHRTDPFARD
jgi:hypothetical protein